MPRRGFFTVFGVFVLVMMLVTGLQIASINAQGGATSTPDDAFPVSVLLVGPVALAEPSGFIFAEGTTVRYDARTAGKREGIKINQQAAVIALVEGDTLIARYLNPSASAMGGQTTEGISIFAILSTPAQPLNLKPPSAEATPDAGTATPPPECSGTARHPVGVWMSQAFGVTYTDLMGWRCRGFVFGDVARVYLLERALITKGKKPVEVDTLFAQRRGGRTWTEIIRGLGLNPADFHRGPVATEDAT